MCLRKIFVLCVACVVLAACARLPEYRDDAVTTADVVRNIKCELRDAAWRSHPGNAWLSGWNAGLILTLEVFHLGGQDSDASFVVPLHPGTFTIGLTSGLSGQATRVERIEFSESLDALNADVNLFCPQDDPHARRHAMLGGRLGMADLFDRARESMQVARIRPTGLDYNLDFIIKASGGVAPRWSVIPIGRDRTFSGGFKLNGSRNDTNTLKITLRPPARTPGCQVEMVDGKCPTPVYLVEPKRMEAKGLPRVRAAPRPGGLSPQDQDSIERGQSRNILQGIDDQLRRQNLN